MHRRGTLRAVTDLAERVERATGRRPVNVQRIGAGATGRVDRLRFQTGPTLVVKTASDDTVDLTIEATGLRLLAERSALPIPAVIAAEPDLLVLQDMPGSSRSLHRAEADAARLIADLHDITNPSGQYGLESDGLIGPLAQLNTPSPSWVEFFRERRLLAMGRAAEAEAALPGTLARRLDRLADRLGDLIPDHPPAALIHGDIWSGNVLAAEDRITALLDPAPHHAHAEVELAFITLFSTFGDEFFSAYRDRARLSESDWRAFRSTRRHVYNAYPLLVHIRLFGGSYIGELDTTLGAIGF